MSRHLQREIDKLRKMILAVGAKVEEALRRAVRAVRNRDETLAAKVIQADAEIDQNEVEVEEEGLKILALHQPVAVDLRFIVSVLKINNDLERIGDLAVNIAERARSIQGAEDSQLFASLPQMADSAKTMLRKSLDALVNLDTRLAREVCASDDAIDSIHRRNHQRAQEEIRRQPDTAPGVIALLSVSRELERIADHATNVAQDVIYMLEGEIVRHRKAEDPSPTDDNSRHERTAE